MLIACRLHTPVLAELSTLQRIILWEIMCCERVVEKARLDIRQVIQMDMEVVRASKT